jgi:hypothetical protein
VLGVDPVPDLDAGLQDQVRQAQAAATSAGVQLRLRADQARARLQLPPGKQAAEEWLTAVVLTRANAVPSINRATGQMGQAALYQCSAESLFAMRAPPGELAANEKLYRTVLSTVRIDPTWQARVSQVQAAMGASNVQSAADRSKIIAKSGEDQRRIINEGYQNRQAALDRTNERFSDALRGVQNFRDPNTGENVKLSNEYAHAWVSGNGEYVMSDSSSFKPGQVLQGSWTELQPVRR